VGTFGGLQSPLFLIPVLVTGIQPVQVLGLERLFRAAEAALLSSCDEHRNEEIQPAVAGIPNLNKP
jgi:hypothetical protein